MSPTLTPPVEKARPDAKVWLTEFMCERCLLPLVSVCALTPAAAMPLPS